MSLSVPAPRFDSDRDDATFHFHRDFARQSVIGYVSANLDDLAEEFLRSRGHAGVAADGYLDVDALETDLRFWEGRRFGQELRAGAHGMLLRASIQRSVGGRGHAEPFWKNREQRQTVEAAVGPITWPEGPGLEAVLAQIAVDSGLMQAIPGKLIVRKTMPTPRPEDLPPAIEREPGCDDGDETDWGSDGEEEVRL